MLIRRKLTGVVARHALKRTPPASGWPTAEADHTTRGGGGVLAALLDQVETVERHDLVPRRDEVLDELLLGVIAGVHLSDSPQL